MPPSVKNADLQLKVRAVHISCSVLHLMISAETQNFVMHYFDGHIYMCIHFAVLVLDCLYCTGLHRSAHIVPCFAVQSIA